jgi:4-hydroxy-3-polyprenylbenzoate decarboxylase
MAYKSLRDFIDQLEAEGDLVRVTTPVSTELEMTEIHKRTLHAGGPAILFENVINERGEKSEMPCLVNLFGTVKRVAQAVTLGGQARTTGEELREVGELLAFLRQPEPPRGLKEAAELLPLAKTVMSMRPKTVKKAPCQDVVLTGDDIDLDRLPIQTCWPGEPAPLITWPLVVTKGPSDDKQDDFNLGSNIVAAPSIISAGRTRSRTRCPPPSSWVPIPAPYWRPSRPSPTRCRNTSSPAYCAARRPSWSIARPSR